jgi:hypothetical protein
MSSPSDPYAALQADVDRHRVDLMETELALCLTYAIIAGQKYESGNEESAEEWMANAEEAYEVVIRVLSDPKHSKHLTEETIQKCRAELERLRDRLDGLRQRFRN